MSSKIYVALLHSPMTNRNNQIVTSSVTNLDLHDISRSCRTYGIENLFVVTPIDEQRKMVQRILEHWERTENLAYHPHRAEALNLIRCVSSFREVQEAILKTDGQKPQILMPDARPLPNQVSYSQVGRLIENDPRSPRVLVFGTGWGIHESFYSEVDLFLEPIKGRNDAYNHLSVRSAVAIVLDRVFRSSNQNAFPLGPAPKIE